MELIQTAGVAEQNRLPVACGLSSYPSPAGSRTMVSYELGRTSPVSVCIHDAAGRCVEKLVDVRQTRGSHTATWDCASSPAGVYYVILRAGSEAMTRPVVVSH